MNSHLPPTGIRPEQKPKTWQQRLAWTLFGICMSFTLLGLALEVLNRVTAQTGTFIWWNAMAIVLCFPIVGLVIALRQPQNPIGWLFFAIGLGPALSWLAASYAVYIYRVNPGFLPGGTFMSWVGYWTFVPGFALLPLLLLLFPNGRLLSPRWRWAVWAILLGALLSTLEFARLSWPLRGAALVPYSGRGGLYEGSDGGILIQIVGAILVSLTAGGFLAAIVGMALRFRRSRGVERQQMKWFAYALSLALCLQFWLIYRSRDHDQIALIPLQALQALSIMGVALAVGIAILRYRLYDIDLIIRKTLVYSVLTAVLALVYWGGVLLSQNLVMAVGGQQPTVMIVLTTLIIAALFNPLRRYIQNTIDRRFYRRKYDARKTLEAFSARVRNEVELAQLTKHLLETVDETVQPAHVSLWLKSAPGAGAQKSEHVAS